VCIVVGDRWSPEKEKEREREYRFSVDGDRGKVLRFWCPETKVCVYARAEDVLEQPAGTLRQGTRSGRRGGSE